MRDRDSSGSTPEWEMPPHFEEVQRFRHWFFYVPVLIVTGVIWWQFGEQVIRGQPQGTQPIPDWLALALTLVFGVGFPVFVLTVRLVTEVRPGLLSVRLLPFRAKTIPVDQIEDAFPREYSAMREFGGWGIRVGKEGKAYNAHGDKGVQLVLKDGSRILIGTQRPEELMDALRLAGADVR